MVMNWRKVYNELNSHFAHQTLFFPLISIKNAKGLRHRMSSLVKVWRNTRKCKRKKKIVCVGVLLSSSGAFSLMIGLKWMIY